MSYSVVYSQWSNFNSCVMLVSSICWQPVTYRQICSDRAATAASVFDLVAQESYTVKDQKWVTYDDKQTFAKKVGSV